MIYLDNAATSGKKPQAVIKAVETALKSYSANPGRSGHTLSLMAADAVYKTREKLAEFFGASGPERVIFTANCTHSINLVVKGILNKGDRVVISSLEHNSVIRPLVKSGVGIAVARVSLTDEKATLEEFKRKITHDTRLVICTGGSNVLGRLLPIKEIGEICRARGVPFCVDAAQIAGVVPINMKEMNIDYLCIAPHKGLYAPMGLGVLIAEVDIPQTLIEGGTGTNSAEPFQPDFLPERLESGTVNLPAIMGLSAGIDYVKQTTPDKIYSYELELIRYLYNELSKFKNIILYTPEPLKGQYAPVLSFNVFGLDSSSVASQLSDSGIAVRGGLHCAPDAHRQIGTVNSGTVRVSVSAFNTKAEINALIKTVRQYS